MQCPHPDIYPQTENVLLIKMISDISRWSLNPKYYSFFRCFCWFLSFFFFCHTDQHAGSFPSQGWNQGPLHWECGVLTTGLPRKFPGTTLNALQTVELKFYNGVTILIPFLFRRYMGIK